MELEIAEQIPSANPEIIPQGINNSEEKLDLRSDEIKTELLEVETEINTTKKKTEGTSTTPEEVFKKPKVLGLGKSLNAKKKLKTDIAATAEVTFKKPKELTVSKSLNPKKKLKTDSAAISVENLKKSNYAVADSTRKTKTKVKETSAVNVTSKEICKKPKAVTVDTKSNAKKMIKLNIPENSEDIFKNPKPKAAFDTKSNAKKMVKLNIPENSEDIFKKPKPKAVAFDNVKKMLKTNITENSDDIFKKPKPKVAFQVKNPAKKLKTENIVANTEEVFKKPKNVAFYIPSNQEKKLIPEERPTNSDDSLKNSKDVLFNKTKTNINTEDIATNSEEIFKKPKDVAFTLDTGTMQNPEKNSKPEERCANDDDVFKKPRDISLIKMSNPKSTIEAESSGTVATSEVSEIVFKKPKNVSLNKMSNPKSKIKAESTGTVATSEVSEVVFKKPKDVSVDTTSNQRKKFPIFEGIFKKPIVVSVEKSFSPKKRAKTEGLVSTSVSEDVFRKPNGEETRNVDDNNNGVGVGVFPRGSAGDSNMNCANKSRSWNLASFLFPDNNLPQSWLNIMEINRKMHPFDDLPLENPSTSTNSASTTTTAHLRQSVVSCSLDSSSNSKMICEEPAPVSKKVVKQGRETSDAELASMPQLTLSIPGQVVSPTEDGIKQDQDSEKEITSNAPTIQPYDSEVIPKAQELPKLIKQQMKSNKEEPSVKLEPVAVQIRIIETRRTRKLGLPCPSPLVATKTLKRKYGASVDVQKQQLLNTRIKSHISAMQRETKKRNPDLEFLRRHMCLEETFKYRMAKFMKDNEHSIENLLKEFPALKIVSIVMDEFERVVEVTNPMVRCNPITFLENALRKRFQRIIAKFRVLPSKDQLPLISTALAKLDKDSQNENLMKIVSSLCMIVNFSTDKSIVSVITVRKEKEAFNYQGIGLPKMVLREKSILLEKSEIRVILEGQEVFRVANIYEGLLAIFAISHVFNLDYDAKIEPLMRYFEYLVDIPQVVYQEEDPLPSEDEI